MVTLKVGDILRSGSGYPELSVIKEYKNYFSLKPNNDEKTFSLRKVDVDVFLDSRDYKLGDWLITPDGKFYPFDTRHQPTSIETIAQSLTYTFRFRGMYSVNGSPISVAKHSLNMSYIPMEAGECLYYLLHDAAEAYISDMPRPVKRDMPKLKRLEESIHSSIMSSLGLGYLKEPTFLKIDDILMCKDELYIMDRSTAEKVWPDHTLHYLTGSPKSLKWEPEKEKMEFIARFDFLMGKLRKESDNV